MNIQTNQVMKVLFQLPDHLLSKFTQGANAYASMTFDAFPERSFELTFQEIDTEADPKTGSYKVTMVMERPEGVGILPGMSGNVHLVSENAGATRIQAPRYLLKMAKPVFGVSMTKVLLRKCPSR